MNAGQAKVVPVKSVERDILVEELRQKIQLQEVELEKTSKQLKEALTRAEKETAKRKAAKDVIKALKAQLKEMNKRLPLGTVRNSSHASNNLGTGQLEASCKTKNRTSDSEANYRSEWIEQDEPGVYVTLVSLPDGIKDLKRVRFSRKRFSEKEAKQWWAANRARIYQQYDVSIVSKTGAGIGKEGIANESCLYRILRRVCDSFIACF